MMLWLEEKCAIMPTDLNICLYCRAKVTQLPGVKSGCTIYCGLQAVACGFPVFVMIETEQKGVSRLWSLTFSKISFKRVDLTVCSHIEALFAILFSLCTRSVKHMQK